VLSSVCSGTVGYGSLAVMEHGTISCSQSMATVSISLAILTQYMNQPDTHDNKSRSLAKIDR